MQRPERTIVIGAGLAGLAAADALRAAGLEVSVLEARDRVGGRVWSVPFGGAVVERGAEFVLPGNTTVEALARRFDLRLVRKGMHYGAREPRGGKPVSGAELAGALERILAAGPGGGTVEAAVAELDLFAPAAEAILARLEVSTGYPANDLDAGVLSEGAAAFGDFDTHTVEGGNSRLAESLAAGLGDSLHLEAPVRALSWSEGRVVAATGDGELEAQAAVIAVPASALATIEFEPGLSGPAAEALAAVRYGQAAKLFVPLASPAPPSATLSVPGRFWCYTQLGPGGEPTSVLASFAGTMGAIESLEVSSGPGRWTRELAGLRPDLDLDPSETLLSSWHDDRWAGGAYSARSASSPLDPEALVQPIGPLCFAGEHTAGEWHGLMEGALRSGERAARQLLAERGGIG
jgi:monoamine oxidase